MRNQSRSTMAGWRGPAGTLPGRGGAAGAGACAALLTARAETRALASLDPGNPHLPEMTEALETVAAGLQDLTRAAPGSAADAQVRRAVAAAQMANAETMAMLAAMSARDIATANACLADAREALATALEETRTLASLDPGNPAIGQLTGILDSGIEILQDATEDTPGSAAS